MAVTDSISIFAEGTFEEQVQELVTYIVRSEEADERAAFIRPFQDVLKTGEGQKPLAEDDDRRRKLFTMVLNEVKGVGTGSEKEIEGFFNLLYSHLFSLFAADSSELKQHLTTLLTTISSSPSEQAAIKYRIHSNLFNALPRRSPLRLTVYNALLSIASTNDELVVLHLSPHDVEKWLGEWEISPAEKSEFLKTIYIAFEKAGQLETSYGYRLSYIRSLPSEPSATDAAVEAIATALRLPSVFDFDQLFKLDAVIAAKDHDLFSLLQLFLNDGLTEFRAWADSHPGVLEKYSLEKTQLEHKIRLLTLASLGFQNIGRDLPYTQVAAALDVEASEVEKWAIDVIRAGLVTGKLSQTTQTLHITRSTSRTFERAQWEALEKRLVAWKSGLAGVLEVVVSARGNAEASISQETVAPVQAVAA
ncbi:hypothetical protein PLICRDRAFT_34102 [Plicaturopsis crispa FD-325 SS-3]|nr:hypothetical protein PLICRDRAFT_34102 [Plicaturopsis crispa FD-325 SS-3]